MKSRLISKSKDILANVKKYNYNYTHTKFTKNALTVIESIKGKTNPRLLKASNEYAVEVLGWSGYSHWLKVYSAMAGEFKEGWIPESYFGNVIVPKLQGDIGETSFLKPLSKKIFNSSNFPDIGYFVNGTFYTYNYEYIVDDNLVKYLFKDTDKVVYKLNNSAQGMGILVFEKKFFDYKAIKRLGDGVFQKYICQNSFFNEIMPNSVSTIRILTVITNKGEASVRSAYLRVGRSQDSHVKSNSQISIPINLDNGDLNYLGYSKAWFTIDCHPDTGFIFENKKIPNFKLILNKALELQKSMSFVKCIGWDMIIDNVGDVQVMEWNGFHTGIALAEFTQGPCFKDLGWENLWK